MTFGERFKEVLEQKEISQKSFAIKMNVSESAISDYVNDRRLPNALLIRDFARELGVSVDYLLDYQPSSETVAVSPKEAALLKKLRKLPKGKREMVTSLVEMLSEK